MFLFLFYWLHLKAGAVYSHDLSLFGKSLIMGQTNAQAAIAENPPWVTQYTLHFKINTLFFETLFDKQLFLKVDKSIEKYL